MSSKGETERVKERTYWKMEIEGKEKRSTDEREGEVGGKVEGNKKRRKKI